MVHENVNRVCEKKTRHLCLTPHAPVEKDGDSRGIFVTEFVVDSREKVDEVMEGEVERDDVGVVYGADGRERGNRL